MSKGKVLLKRYDVSDDIFDAILKNYWFCINQVESLKPYIYGYRQKYDIMYEKTYVGEELIVLETLFLDTLNIKHKCNTWKQVWLRKVDNMTETHTETVTGTYATNYINKLLVNNGYTKEEIEECLNSHILEVQTSDDKQIHIQAPVEMPEDKIYLFRDCYKFDINGAHCDAMCEIFPKAKKSLQKLYNTRKQCPQNKQIINFYVGNLCNNNHRYTYNWIVRRTTEILRDTIITTGGKVVYANTDGVCIWNSQNIIETNNELGSFKLEYHGDVYYYYHRPSKECSSYFIFQFGDEYKGNARKVVRELFDMQNGIVVDYKANKTIINNEFGEFKIDDITDVKTKKVEIEEYNYD